MTFAEQLRTAREKTGRSQLDVAQAVGIGLSTYRDYEAGRSDPTSIVARLMRELDIDPSVLLNASDNTERREPS